MNEISASNTNICVQFLLFCCYAFFKKKSICEFTVIYFRLYVR